MVADERVARPAFLSRPFYDVGQWAVVRDEIHVDGRDVREGVAEIPA